MKHFKTLFDTIEVIQFPRKNSEYSKGPMVTELIVHYFDYLKKKKNDTIVVQEYILKEVIEVFLLMK